MKQLFVFIFLFLLSCVPPNTVHIINNKDLDFNKDLTFNEFKEFLIKYAETTPYPDINK